MWRPTSAIATRSHLRIVSRASIGVAAVAGGSLVRHGILYEWFGWRDEDVVKREEERQFRQGLIEFIWLHGTAGAYGALFHLPRQSVRPTGLWIQENVLNIAYRSRWDRWPCYTQLYLASFQI